MKNKKMYLENNERKHLKQFIEKVKAKNSEKIDIIIEPTSLYDYIVCIESNERQWGWCSYDYHMYDFSGYLIIKSDIKELKEIIKELEKKEKNNLYN